MLCYECSVNGVSTEAVALCSHCAAGLCAEHAHAEADVVRSFRPHSIFGTVKQVVELPIRARKLLCNVCRQALHQRGSGEAAGFRPRGINEELEAKRR